MPLKLLVSIPNAGLLQNSDISCAGNSGHVSRRGCVSLPVASRSHCFFLRSRLDPASAAQSAVPAAAFLRSGYLHRGVSIRSVFRVELSGKLPNEIDLFKATLETARLPGDPDDAPFADYLAALFQAQARPSSLPLPPPLRHLSSGIGSGSFPTTAASYRSGATELYAFALVD